jgi:hypothetical protein
MKANFGILPPLDHPPRDKRARAALYVERAQRDLDDFRSTISDLGLQGTNMAGQFPIGNQQASI